MSGARTNQAKAWCCPNGHVLGLVTKVNGRHALAVFRTAMDKEAQPGKSFSVAGIAIGQMVVMCSVCGMSRVWHYIDAATEDLLAKARRN